MRVVLFVILCLLGSCKADAQTNITVIAHDRVLIDGREFTAVAPPTNPPAGPVLNTAPAVSAKGTPVIVTPTPNGDGVALQADPIRAFALDGHMTWQEFGTYIGGSVAALALLGSQTDWFGLEDNSDTGGLPINGHRFQVIADHGAHIQLNFQGSGSGGSGQQSGAESLTGANAGAGGAGN